ncbi:MAG: anthranilate synthase component I [Acidobacteriaceae bacterium]
MSGDISIAPSRAEFLELAANHTLVPVYRTLTADLETPVSAFLRLASNEPQSFLLESVEGGEKVGRYTFIGVRPYRTILSRGKTIVDQERGKTRNLQGDVFALLKQLLGGQKPARIAGLPPFTCGAVGFFAYDVVRQLERLPELAKDDLEVPDACLMFFDEVLAFDHVRKQIQLMVTADLGRMKPAAAYKDAKQRLANLEKRLSRPIPKTKRSAARGKLTVTSHTDKKDFLASVEKIKEYIVAGDVFQTVLSQRFEVKPGVDPFSVYRALRIVNPSPYLYFLRFDLDRKSTCLVGSSPELLVRVQQRQVEYRPIAGTRPRSANEQEDLRIEEELRTDEKEQAEHVMLVDLGRNDIGRVCEFGTVRVKSLMHVERYSHVMHLVSSLEGRLRPELSAVDAFCACFPAGTLSGAPKIRAMEIIEELEPSRRGIYGGSVFYADFSGNFDSCIAIRSMLVKGDQGYIQAGGGIVADSVPENEYQESVNKAKAVVRAVEQARAANKS